VINEGYELVGLDRLRPHPRNPRQGDLEAIGQSIDVNGFYGAVVASKRTGHILAGNHRFLAAKAQGLAEVPVTWVDVDEVGEARILAADNRTSDLGEYDDALLAGLLQGLDEAGGLLGTGYGEDDLAELLDGLTSVFDAPEGVKEMAPEDFSSFAHQCPRCSFEFDD